MGEAQDNTQDKQIKSVGCMEVRWRLLRDANGIQISSVRWPLSLCLSLYTFQTSSDLRRPLGPDQLHQFRELAEVPH